jgi:hypothetical protein
MACASIQKLASEIRRRLPDERGDKKRCARPGKDEIHEGFSGN